MRTVASISMPGGHSLHLVKNRGSFVKGCRSESSPYF